MEIIARRLGNKRKKEPRIFLPTRTHGKGRFPGGGICNTLQYSCLGNPMDRGAWQATVNKVTKSQTQLSTHVHTSKNDWLFFTFSSHWVAPVFGPQFWNHSLVPSALRYIVSATLANSGILQNSLSWCLWHLKNWCFELKFYSPTRFGLLFCTFKSLMRNLSSLAFISQFSWSVVSESLWPHGR